jgi:hypothetical protein
MKHGMGTLIAALAMAGALAEPIAPGKRAKDFDWWGDRQDPIDTGRRAEKNAEALRKAEAKRERKAAKRRAAQGHNGAIKAGGALPDQET